jgi:S1-C subfamily serine protease
MKHLTRLLCSSLLSIVIPPCAGVAQEPSAKDLAYSLQAAFAEAIERAEPSIVSVVRIRHPDRPDTLSFLRGPEVLRQERIDPRNPNWVPTDFGSGVIIDAAGLVLTNHHVIELADEVWVVLHDGKAHQAKIQAADPRSDLAVLSVPARNLKPITIGDSSKVKKGHLVLALGNPYATARDGRASASWGIISNIARRLPPPENQDELTLHHNATLLQTDARLNYGTSGGALINLNGEMIGLVTSLAAIRGYDQAAGYAIPMDATMQRILGVLREGLEMEYGFLGIGMSDVEPDEREPAAGLTPLEGAKVATCYEGTPAYQAGMQMEDVIVAIENIPVRNREELVMTVGTRFSAGDRVNFSVVRSRKRVNIPVTLGKFPVAGQVISSQPPRTWRGLRVEYTTVLMRDRYRGQELLRRAPDGGVLVIAVESGSPAAEAGLTSDMIVTHVGNTRVRNPAEFFKAAESAKGKVEVATDQGKFSISD